MGTGGEKSVFIWITLFFKPGASVVNFMGNGPGSGGHHNPRSPGHPGLAHLSSQQRGKSPCAERGLCGLLSIADPALPLDLLAFQFLLEKTSESCPLSPSPSAALPVKLPARRRRHVRDLEHQGVAARQDSWGSPFTRWGGSHQPLSGSLHMSLIHTAAPQERRGVPVLPKGRHLGPVSLCDPFRFKGRVLGRGWSEAWSSTISTRLRKYLLLGKASATQVSLPGGRSLP